MVLDNFYRAGFKPALVVSPPDKTAGRGLKTIPTAVSSFAAENGIPLIKPPRLKEDELREKPAGLAGDLFIVADYGKILPSFILTLPKICVLGVHPSLLPRYRGAAPINWAIIKGERQTGVTIFKVNEEVDGGEIILSRKISIADSDNVVSLTAKLAKEGAAALAAVVEKIKEGGCVFTPQEEKRASFAPKLKKEDGKINWQDTAANIRNLIRGVWGWPSAYTYYKDKMIKVLETAFVSEQTSSNAATITKIDKQGIYVATGEGILQIRKLKPEGKKEMDAYSFVCGYRVKAGDKFR